MAENSPASNLIAIELEVPEFATLLNDIRDFDWPIVNRLRKEDLARIQSTGFRFTTKGDASRKKEFQSFLLQHPSCMASDFEMIIWKLNIFARLWGDKNKEPERPAITHEKPKKKKRIVIESSSSDEWHIDSDPDPDPNDDYEEEDPEVIRKRGF